MKIQFDEIARTNKKFTTDIDEAGLRAAGFLLPMRRRDFAVIEKARANFYKVLHERLEAEPEDKHPVDRYHDVCRTLANEFGLSISIRYDIVTCFPEKEGDPMVRALYWIGRFSKKRASAPHGLRLVQA